MKQVTRILRGIALTSVAAGIAASAQGVTITVDELGNGFFGGTPIPSSMQTEPLSGMTTLAYQLPFPAVPGDVILIEPGVPQPAPPSDVIRFDGQFTMYFFGKSDGPPFDPADVGLPPPVPGLNTITLIEQGPEGNNGVFYFPNGTGSDPGDNTAFADYHFVSDGIATPEPATLALLSVAGALLLHGRRRTLSVGTSK